MPEKGFLLPVEAPAPPALPAEAEAEAGTGELEAERRPGDVAPLPAPGEGSDSELANEEPAGSGLVGERGEDGVVVDGVRTRSGTE